MNRSFFLSLCFVLPVTAFAQTFSITAKLTGFADHSKFYLDDAYERSVIDSAVLVNGMFSMHGNIKEPKPLILYTKIDGKNIYMPLVIGNENVMIIGDKKEFPKNITVQGSKHHLVFGTFEKENEELYKRRDSLHLIRNALAKKLMGQKVSDSSARNFKDVTSQLALADTLIKFKKIEYVRTNINSYAVLSEITHVKELFSLTEYRELYDRLKEPYKSSSYGKAMNLYLTSGNPLKVGDSFKDFEALDQFGKSHRLSEIKGKYILLDFWYKDCPPCIAAIKGLKKLAATYPEKLSIVSFSADAKRENWLKGLARDNPSWLNLWDGKGFTGPTIAKYVVGGYPAFYMINPEGKIVLLSSGYNEAEFLRTMTAVLEER